MKIRYCHIHNYILIQFFKSLLGAVILFTGLLIIYKVLEQLPSVLKQNTMVSGKEFVMYILYEVPFWMKEIFPLGSLFSIVYTLGQLNSQNELIAIYNSGTPITFAVYPIFIIISLLCIVLFIFDKEILYDNHAKHRLLHRKIHHRTDTSQKIRKELTVFGKNNKIYFIKEYIPKFNKMQNAHILYLDQSFNFIKVVSAQQIVYDLEKDMWAVSNGMVRTWKTNSDQPEIEAHEQVFYIALDEKPFHFERRRERVEHLSSKEVLQLAKKYEIIGGNSQKYYSEYYLKTATPFIALVIIFFGIPLSVFSRKSTLILSFFLVLVAFFVYIVLINIGTSLGANGILPPFIAGWFGNIMFLIIGFFLHRKLTL